MKNCKFYGEEEECRALTYYEDDGDGYLDEMYKYCKDIEIENCDYKESKLREEGMQVEFNCAYKTLQKLNYIQENSQIKMSYADIFITAVCLMYKQLKDNQS